MTEPHKHEILADFSASLQFWDYSIVRGPKQLKPHSHHYWQMNLADKGEAVFYCENKKYHVKPWNILIIPPQCRHEIIYPEGEFGCFSFKFHLRAFPRETMEALFLPESRETKALITIVQTLVRELFPEQPPGDFRHDLPVTGDDDYAAVLEPLLQAVLIRYYRLYGNRMTLGGQLRQLLVCNQGRQLSVEEAAAHFSYSPNHFSVLIKNETGLGAKQFIDRERSRIACHYLEFTHMNAGEVAAHMGFPDILTFCHFFKRQCGFSPGAFQKNILSGAAHPAPLLRK